MTSLTKIVFSLGHLRATRYDVRALIINCKEENFNADTNSRS